MKKLHKKLASWLAIASTALVIGATTAQTSALQYTGWVVTFEDADKTQIDVGISNALGNLWAGFQFILPYLWVALWIMIVMWAVFFLARRAWR